MPLDPQQCPVDLEEVAEGYAMGTLPQEGTEAFEEHLLVCARCREAVKAADEFLRAMRAAAVQMRRSENN